MAKINIQDKKDLIDRVRSLTDSNEHKQLLRVIIKNRIKFTENTNGCFIDLNKVDDKVIDKLFQVVELCEQNRDYNEKMNALLEETRKEVDVRYEYKLSRKNETKKKTNEIIDTDAEESEEEDNVVVDDGIESEEESEAEGDGNGPDDN